MKRGIIFGTIGVLTLVFSVGMIIGFSGAREEALLEEAKQVDNQADYEVTETSLIDDVRLIEIPEFIQDYMEKEGYEVLSEPRNMMTMITDREELLEMPMMGIWGLQGVSLDEYLGKEIQYYTYDIKNHPLDHLGDMDSSWICLMVYKDKIIGGYSMYNNSETVYGGVYTMDGLTLEEMTGFTYAQWLDWWREKYASETDIYKDMENDMPKVMPEDFEIVFKFGTKQGGRFDGIDTVESTIQKDLVMDGQAIADKAYDMAFKEQLYNLLRSVNVVKYPGSFNPLYSDDPEPGVEVYATPSMVYELWISYEDVAYRLDWDHDNSSTAANAEILWEAFKGMMDIIMEQPEYIDLGQPNGGYVMKGSISQKI